MANSFLVYIFYVSLPIIRTTDNWGEKLVPMTSNFQDPTDI